MADRIALVVQAWQDADFGQVVGLIVMGSLAVVLVASAVWQWITRLAFGLQSDGIGESGTRGVR